MRELASWHKEETKYLQNIKDKQNSFLPGFSRGRFERKKMGMDDVVDWEIFKVLLKKWHMKLGAVRQRPITPNFF
ncbi:MAG TPA: hypothetical protein VGO47_00960 [Chlamydiales bacterium]|nr:hypothetical protein [Chlamydiales bacterium]